MANWKAKSISLFIDLSKFESNQQESEAKESDSQDTAKTEVENALDEAVEAEDQPVSDSEDEEE